jgi:hypothetical protein
LDVNDVIVRVGEPASTERLRGLLSSVRARLSAAQADAMVIWEDALPFDGASLGALRGAVDDPVALRRQVALMRRRADQPPAGTDEQLAAVPALLQHAAAKPSVVSAMLWSWLRLPDGDIASQLVQLVRERAGLPPLRRRIAVDEPALAKAGGSGPALVACFADRVVEDGCAWLGQVPPPLDPTLGATLSDQAVAVATARENAARVALADFAPFARRAASFLVQLSARGIDPVGFSLARDVQLDGDPTLSRRLEIAAWAQRAGHLVCAPGHLFVLSIAVDAPWPLVLELIAAEPGRGTGGGLGLLLRLHGGSSPPVTERAPMLLTFPGEPAEELGVRFERWLADAYPSAVGQWRAWC